MIENEAVRFNFYLRTTVQFMRFKSNVILISCIGAAHLGCGSAGHSPTSRQTQPSGDYARSDASNDQPSGHVDLSLSARDSKHRVRATIEIPAGTVKKYEVDKRSGALVWERRNGKRRVIEYLGYPANYGFVPSTLAATEHGGDGDPLDIMVLGPPLPRGTVVGTRVIAALRLMDDGERDDKLIAVPVDSAGAFAQIHNLEELDAQFPEASHILELWFTNYDRKDETVSEGMVERAEALRILERAIAECAHSCER